MAKTDLLVLTIAADDMPNAWDTMILEEAEKRCIPVIGVVSKVDIAEGQEVENWFESRKLPFARVNSNTREGIDKLKDLITSNSPKDFLPETIVGDLLKQNDIVILVTPVDAGAPKSRLILPQVQVLRDALDARACVMVVTEHELKTALNALKQPPRLVITDSQAFDFVSKVVPSDVPLTSFSILFARYKGDLREFLNGIKAIDTLAAGDKVLIAEACTHFPSHEDIGRVKIPKWLETKVGGKLDFSWVVGSDFPENLADFKLVVHCGACMINRAEVLARLDKCKALDIPVVNYGIMIGYVTGVLNRVVKPLEK